MKKTTKNVLLRSVWVLILILSLTSCVSLKGYREVKSQMIWNEIENSKLQSERDSWEAECKKRDKIIEEREKEKAALNKEVETLKSENSRLRTNNSK
ncbi:MAG: hypothetical protein R3Y61_03250 [Rikenellaceae bacterium]